MGEGDLGGAEEAPRAGLIDLDLPRCLSKGTRPSCGLFKEYQGQQGLLLCPANMVKDTFLKSHLLLPSLVPSPECTD